MRNGAAIILILLGLSCANGTSPHAAKGGLPATRTAGASSRPAETARAGSWAGVYAMPGEVAGFARDVLLLNDEPTGRAYRERIYSDAILVGEIPQRELHGEYLTDGNTLYLPRASGFIHEGKPSLTARIDRYTHVRINGRDVLMRDDALRAFHSRNKLYDYGILIKVSDNAGLFDLATVKRPSIKILYADPKKPWADPFVHGPNER